MPIMEIDPWRQQYFADYPCPPGVFIPTEDSDAWNLYPAQRWIYDKLRICMSQDILAAPHGVTPAQYPVFSKPIYNLNGMGVGSGVLHDVEDYARWCQPGHLWMRLLEGDHLSTDAALVRGEVRWWRHCAGRPLGEGMFDYWTVESAPRPDLERYLATWAGLHLRGYTGMVNIETIGGQIIEAHLRFSDQWPDLLGPGWVQALIRLYAEGVWEFEEGQRRTGYSVVLFGPHGHLYRHPPRILQAEIRALRGVSSLQITFHEDRPAEAHAMPPGGFRLAIVNCFDLSAGQEARRRLAHWFGVG